MKYLPQIRSISHLKANTARIVREVGDTRNPFIITQNGEAKVVIQDVVSYDETQESLALLRILAMGDALIA